MKTLSMLLVFIISHKITVAQDKLVRTNSEVVLSKVIEITETAVKYKKYDNLEGPIYTEDKSNFVSVIFENGKIEAIVSDRQNNNDRHNGKARFTPLNPKYKNTIDFDFFSLYTADISLQYTHYLKNEHFAITVPFRIGWYYNTFNGMYLLMEENNNYYNYNSYYYYGDNNRPKGFKLLTGVNVKYFYKKAVKFRGYIAPEFVVGVHQSSQKYIYYDNSTQMEYMYTYKHTAGTLGIMGVWGFQAVPSPRVTIKLEVAGGYAGMIGKDIYRHNTFVGRATLAVGYNFKKLNETTKEK